jgi:hypothetical protein
MKYLPIIACAAFILTGSVPATGQPAKVTGDVRPLTYANVVSFFKEARLHPTEVQKRCTVFFEGEWKSADIYSYCLIIVENSDEDIQVTFYLTDAHEMNWVTEFFDAPFFAPAETQGLFRLINSKREVAGESIGRYRVDFHHWRPRHANILVFSFIDRQTRSRRVPNR